jgi:hypothetical protein
VCQLLDPVYARVSLGELPRQQPPDEPIQASPEFRTSHLRLTMS